MQARLTTSAIWRAGWRTALLTALLAGWPQAPLGAQYISPGSVAAKSEIPAKELLEENVERSRWKLGRLRVAPWVGLRDASFVSRQRDQQGLDEEDLTVTAGAGLRAYLPAGKAIWAAHAQPEYVWWQDDDRKRSLNGRYGLGLFGYFNRLRFQLSFRSIEEQLYFSSEIQELTSSRTDTSTLSLELDVARRVVLYGTADYDQISNQEGESDVFSLLDRDGEVFSVGLRYRTPRGWTFGLGVEETTVDFDASARNLSSSGTSEVVEVGFEGNRVDFRLSVAFRDLRGEPGSDFGVFDETTGNLEFLWDLSPRLTALTYARQRQVFSVDQRNSLGLEERAGVRLDFVLPRSTVGLLAETGEDEYRGVDGGRVERLEDVTAFGAALRFELGDLAVLAFQVLNTRYESSQTELDREITNVGFSIELGALIEKLSLGPSAGDW